MNISNTGGWGRKIQPFCSLKHQYLKNGSR